jgi:hypothetical protein
LIHLPVHIPFQHPLSYYHPKQKSVAATNTTVGANEIFRVKIADPKILGRESTSTYKHFFNFLSIAVTRDFRLTNRERKIKPKFSVQDFSQRSCGYEG